MDPADGNPWRTLARELSIPHTTEVVWIPDLQEALLDEVRYGYDRAPFQQWLDTQAPGRSVDPRELYPEWRFNHQVEADGRSGFSQAGRNSFLCLYAKLKDEDLWSEVATVRWVGETGEMTFFAKRGSAALQDFLAERGYGDWWLASKESPWGVRSRFRGAQLHFRGFLSDTAPDNVHIDLHNPGDPPPAAEPADDADGIDTSGALRELPGAVLHFVEDLHNRRHSHHWQALRAALVRQGIWLPPVVP